MDVVVALIALGLAVGGIYRVLPIASTAIAAAADRLRRRLSESPVLPAGDKPFRILALGVAGSGKTVFLASMFNKLCLPDPGPPRRRYALTTSHRSALELNDRHAVVVDPDGDWPDNTVVAQTATYKFHVAVTTDDGTTHKLIPVEYIDYAGELLEKIEHADSEHFAALDKFRRKANVILWFIDGHKLVQYINGEQAGITHFEAAIVPMLIMLHEARCPVHLVITKWDVVKNIGEDDPSNPESRLSFVRQHLEGHDKVRQVIEQVGRQRFVRLIPVSAVGDDFAEPDGPNGMVKLRNETRGPINVELPLALSIPDFMHHMELQLDDENIDKLRTAAKHQLVDGRRRFRLLSDLLAGAIGAAGQLAAGPAFMVNLVGSWLIRSIDRSEIERAKRKRKDAEKQLAELELRISVLNDLEKVAWGFEFSLPSGIISGSYNDLFDGHRAR